MDDLLLDLYELTAQREEEAGERPDCYALRERHLGRVRDQLGGDFVQKLRDVLEECARLDSQAAFLRGLRLGLALHRL